jgi:hypothetical protein
MKKRHVLPSPSRVDATFVAGRRSAARPGRRSILAGSSGMRPLVLISEQLSERFVDCLNY